VTQTTLWVAQILIGVFFIVAAAAPKLLGERYVVEMFDQIGGGTWLRLLTGALELAGGVGLLIPRLCGLAALGLVGVMAGASYTTVFVLDTPARVVLPAVLGVVLALIAWGRWPETRALFTGRRRPGIR
ncbi:DoxX family protein, partial [Micromonospora echinofusca]|uniref:DoxX family protein n=1 Tax=Micromonospora echinofusca TaxID=47858 RepID=UPI001FCDE339